MKSKNADDNGIGFWDTLYLGNLAPNWQFLGIQEMRMLHRKMTSRRDARERQGVYGCA